MTEMVEPAGSLPRREGRGIAALRWSWIWGYGALCLWGVDPYYMGEEEKPVPRWHEEITDLGA